MKGGNYMLKITIEIVEKEKGSCKVTLKNPKDLSKATEIEKKGCAVVSNKISKAIAELQD